ncbi:MAG: N-acetyltransferase family protein [Candidatus Nanohalobium sp.]
MRIREASLKESDSIVDEFWLPLAREMERYSRFNSLKDDARGRAREAIREKFSEDNYTVYVLEDSEEKIGYISVEKGHRRTRKKDSYAEILSFYVKKDFRGQGYGTELIEHVKKEVEEDCDYLKLYVESENEKARRLYRREGFKKKQVEYCMEI